MAQATSELSLDLAGMPRVGSLLDAAQAGSPEAIGQLFGAVRAYLLLAANRDLPRSVRGKVGPSDIVQDALLAAHCGFASFRGGTPAEFFGWMRAILRHRVADSVRRHALARSRSVRCEQSLEEIDPSGEPTLVARSSSPESAAIRGEEARSLEQMLLRLSVDQRTVIWMRHWEGRSFAEIARECDKSEAAIRKIWGRGFQRLKSLIESQGAGSAASGPGGG
jgi:RNA polymerase sigma-70 factor (ECF subfamily)